MPKVRITDVPIADSVDPAVAMALRQLVGNTKAIITAIESDEIAFASKAGTVTVAHRLGRLPTRWGVVDADGTATIYVSPTNKTKWTTTAVVFTTSGTGTNFKVELR